MHGNVMGKSNGLFFLFPLAFEVMLKKTAGVYSFGDTITMADVVLVPQYYNGVR